VPEGSLTSVPGVRVGHWTNAVAATGVTVMVFPEPNIAAFEARGAAPGTRETALLAPDKKVEMVQAIVFAGGSAFGLDAASGVVAEVEREGRGHPTPAALVPIVPAAILYDLVVGDGSVRPDAAAGAAAYRAAHSGPVEVGSVGAGTGATAAKWRGREHIVRAGVGSAAVRAGDAIVGCLVVVNAMGDVFDVDGTPITGGPPAPGPPAFATSELMNTTLVTVATDAKLDRVGLIRLVVRAHDAIGACLRPAHTRYDGDAVFAVSCGERMADPDALGEAAFAATAAAIVDGVASADEGPVPWDPKVVL